MIALVLMFFDFSSYIKNRIKYIWKNELHKCQAILGTFTLTSVQRGTSYHR